MNDRRGRAPIPHFLIALRLAVLAAVVTACAAVTPPALPPTDSSGAPARSLETAAQPTDGSTQPIGPAPSATAPVLATPAPSTAPTAGPTATPARPTPTSVALDPQPQAGKFALDLGRPNAFVRQKNADMCVPAAMQTMINLMSDQPPDRTRETQVALYTLARSYSPWITPDRDGAAANGWAAGLEHLGYGDFEPMSLPTMADALKVAARQMRYTGRPVGLVVWHGDHAWVMSGFKANADPAWTDDFDVTAVWVEDPWFGRTDRTWGSGLEPHTLLDTTELAGHFVAWPSRWFAPVYGSANRFVIVAPRS